MMVQASLSPSLFIVVLLLQSGLLHSRLFIPNPVGNQKDQMRHGDDEFYDFSISKPVKIGGEIIQNFKVSFNGGILPTKSSNLRTPWLKFPASSILPYWADATFKSSFQESRVDVIRSPDATTLAIIRAQLNIFPDADRTLIITWHEAYSFSSTRYANTFQGIITGDSQGKVYAIFSYETLQYGDTVAKVGVTFSDHYVVLQGSESSAQKLTLRSNVNIPGVFVIGLNTDSDHYYPASTVSPQIVIEATCSHVPGETTYNQVCPEVYSPQCGSDGKTYGNKCEFDNEACKLNGAIKIARTGTCDGETTPTTKPTTRPTTTPSQPSDINCLINNGGCEDKCDQTTNPNRCICTIGKLNTDARSCNYDQVMAILSFSAIHFVYDNMIQDEVGGFEHNILTALAFDYRRKRIFYANLKNEVFTDIGYVSLPSKVKTKIMTVQSTVIEGLAFNPKTDTLYFTGYNKWQNTDLTGRFSTINNVYSNDRTVVDFTTSMSKPRGLALDFCYRIAFVGDSGTEKIYAFYEDGRPAKVLATKIEEVNMIALDREQHKVYFADSYLQTLEVMNYDGSCRRFIAAMYNQHPYGIGLVGGNLFWTNWNNITANSVYGLWKTNIYTGVTEVANRFTQRQNDLIVLQKQETVQCQPISANPNCTYEKFPVPELCWKYGKASGDKQAPPGDDNTAGELDLVLKEIPLSSTKQRKIFINPNGIISFGVNDSRTTVPIPDSSSTGKVFIAGYVADMVSYEIGKAWYRESTANDDLATVVQYTSSKDPSFKPNHVVVITYEEVLAFSAFMHRQTFQVAIASDDNVSYVVWCFGGLDQPGGVVGFYENACNYGIVEGTNTQLVARKTHVLKLSNNNCVSTQKPPVTTTSTQKPPSTTTTKSPPTHSTTITPVPSEHWLYYTGELKAMEFEQVNTTIPINERFSPGAIFTQMVSGTSMNFMYLLQYDDERSALELKLPYLTMTNGRTENDMKYQVLSIDENTPQSDHFRFGKIKIPIFSLGIQYCVPHIFPRKLNSKPIVLLNTQIQYFHISQLVSTWLSNVTEHGFSVCLQELYSFSGVKYNMTVHYAALTHQTTTSEISGSNIPSEVDFMTFPVGPLSQDHPENENIRYCRTLAFKRQYHEPPRVFATAQVGSRGIFNGQVMVWIRSINRASAEICAKNQNDYYYGRADDIYVHVVVKGQSDSCSDDKNCPKNLQCRVNDKGRPGCHCIESCPTDNLQDICGTDFVTYKSMCHLYKESCESYGKETMGNITVAYQGRCKNYPYVSGVEILDSIAGVSVAFCKYIALNKALFHPILRVHVMLTVETRHNRVESKIELYDAATCWSEDVTTSGFKACAMIAGRHFFDGIMAPIIHWTAFQIGITRADEGAMDGGMVKMPTWYSGSRCHNISVRYPEKQPQVTVSVEHNKGNSFSDAMTAWVESTPVINYNGTTIYTTYRVCSRELQNFDGIHKGVIVHWMAYYKPIRLFVPETTEISFDFSTTKDGESPPVVCKKKSTSNVYPFISNPTIMMTPKSQTNNLYSRYSNNDYVAWIQSNNGQEVNICVKSLQTASSGGMVDVNFQVIPNLCGSGWSHYEGRCLYYSTFQGTYSAATSYCTSLGATLAVLDFPSKSYFAERLAANTGGTWIGLSDITQEGIWKWNNGATAVYTDWIPGQPDGGRIENCAVIQQIGLTKAWIDVSCSNSYTAMCEKPIVVTPPTCEKPCLNTGSCVFNGAKAYCRCPSPFYGDQCEKTESSNSECINYVSHTESYRRYTGVVSAPVTRPTCDRDLVSNVTWHRFIGASGTKIMELNCPGAINHCGVRYPGWLNGKHPDVSDGIKRIELKFFFSYCASTHGAVNVRNCGDFFVYNFVYLPYWDCDYGICTTL